MSDRAAASAGFVVAGVALAAEMFVRSPDSIRSYLLAALVAVAFVAFGARRYERVTPTVGAPVAGAAGAGYAVAVPTTADGFDYLTVIAVLAGLSMLVLAAMDWRGITDEQLGERAQALAVAAILGVAGLLSIAVWTSLLGALVGVDGLGRGARYVVGTVAIAPGAATVAGLYVFGTDRGTAFFDLPRPGRRDVALAAVGGLVLLGLNLLADAVAARSGVEFASHGLVDTAQSEPAVLLVLVPLALLIVGPGEELIYRNIVQKSLYDAFSRREAIVAASAIFAAVHFSAYAGPGNSPGAIAIALATVFVLSLVLGVLYERTENLLVPALAHGAFDAVVYLVLYAEVTGFAG